MTDDLRQRIERAAQVLQEHGAREVYLFGSAARDNMREGSDVDLAVAGLPPERFFRAMYRAHRALGAASLDLVDLDEENPFTQCLRKWEDLQRVL